MKIQVFIRSMIFFFLVALLTNCSGNGSFLGTITIDAGDHDRINTPLRYECRLADILGSDASLMNGKHLVLTGSGSAISGIPVQWEPKAYFPWENNDGSGALVWILKGRLKKGEKKTLKLMLRDGEPSGKNFSIEDVSGRSLLVRSGNKPVFQYNYGIIHEKEGQEGIHDKSSYLHPVWTPEGDTITGDFSPEHKWQRGIFLAWQKVKFGDILTNFWELGTATGRTLKDGIDPEQLTGPVFSELVVHNRGTVEGKTFFLEKCIVRLYDIPENDRWIFDITFRQWPVDPGNPGSLPADIKVMDLQQVYYGGMSFRGVSPGWLHYDFVAKNKEQLSQFPQGTRWLDPADSLDILTSEGFTRKKGNATPARWIDYTGPLASGWGGLVMFDNPSNKRYPTPLRIHPDMPYFCFAFTKDDHYAVTSESPLELSYRVVVHNGHPDKDVNEKYAADFSSPPSVQWKGE